MVNMHDYYSKFGETNSLNDDKSLDYYEQFNSKVNKKKVFEKFPQTEVQYKHRKSDKNDKEKTPDENQKTANAKTKYKDAALDLLKVKPTTKQSSKHVSDNLKNNVRPTTTNVNVLRNKTKEKQDDKDSNLPDESAAIDRDDTTKSGQVKPQTDTSLDKDTDLSSKNDIPTTETYLKTNSVTIKVNSDKSLYEDHISERTYPILETQFSEHSDTNGVYIGKGTLVGICVGAVVFVVAIVVVMFILARRSRRQSPISNEMYRDYKLSSKMATRAPVPEPRDTKPSSSSANDVFLSDASAGGTESCIYDFIYNTDVIYEISPRTDSNNTEYIELTESPKYDYAATFEISENENGRQLKRFSYLPAVPRKNTDIIEKIPD